MICSGMTFPLFGRVRPARSQPILACRMRRLKAGYLSDTRLSGDNLYADTVTPEPQFSWHFRENRGDGTLHRGRSGAMVAAACQP